jgi:hypothetical protein
MTTLFAHTTSTPSHVAQVYPSRSSHLHLKVLARPTTRARVHKTTQMPRHPFQVLAAYNRARDSMRSYALDFLSSHPGFIAWMQRHRRKRRERQRRQEQQSAPPLVGDLDGYGPGGGASTCELGSCSQDPGAYQQKIGGPLAEEGGETSGLDTSDAAPVPFAGFSLEESEAALEGSQR